MADGPDTAEVASPHNVVDREVCTTQNARSLARKCDAAAA